jgi:hypothetical protein
MKKYIISILFLAQICLAQSSQYFKQFFMQGNNINTVFSNNGISNYDKITYTSSEAGFIWPAASTTRRTAIFASGIWLAAKVGPQGDLRTAASCFDSHFSPGNIPVIGGVPPSSVCADSIWRGFLVNLTDQTLINGGTRAKFAGGRLYYFVYSSWASWPVDKGAPYVEVNGIPGYQPSWDGDRPGIGNGMTARPEELSFVSFMDYTNCTNNIHPYGISLPGGTLPMGAEIHEINFMFNCPPIENMYFSKWVIINRNSLNWDSAYFSIYADIDIGGAFDDSYGCDTIRNMSFLYNADNSDQEYGTGPPSCGTRLLQSPIVFTGNNNDSAKLPYDTLVGYRVTGMTSSIDFRSGSPDPCFNDPDDYIAGYNFMKGKDGCGRNIINPLTGLPTTFRMPGDACNRIGWFDSSNGGSDRRYIQSSGPFKINSGDTQIVAASFMITRDEGNNHQNVCALQSISDSALYHYYNDFKLCIPIGIQPISTEIPQTFALFQNYPNPFNPATKIRFNIPLLRGVDAEGRRGVLLKIYDALGREIEILVNEELNPGTYEVEWNAEKYSSGIYFYRLTSGDFSQTRKLVLVK